MGIELYGYPYSLVFHNESNRIPKSRLGIMETEIFYNVFRRLSIKYNVRGDFVNPARGR